MNSSYHLAFDERLTLGFNPRLPETPGMSAVEAVLKTGIAVIAVGHRRCKELGLRALAGVMRERWSGLKVCCHPEDELQVIIKIACRK
jgi:hypothetical protein